MLKEEFLGIPVEILKLAIGVINESLIVYSWRDLAQCKTMHAVNCDSACSRERHAMSVIFEHVWFCNNSES